MVIRLLRFLYGSGHRLGLGRAVVIVARHLRVLRRVAVPMDDGRRLVLDLSEPQNLPYLLYGRIPYERGEESVVRALVRTGEQAIDVGANVGWYSTLLAELVGPTGCVYAFEPNRDLVRNLTRTASTYSWVLVVNAAVGDTEGCGTLRISHLLGNSSLEEAVPEQRGTQSCDIVTLDGFLKSLGDPQITFIKSDTEGGELRVLAGARRAFRGDCPPACLVEVNPNYGVDPAMLRAFFEGVWPGCYSAWRVDSESGVLLQPVFGSDVSNALFVPKWMAPRVAPLIAR